jgi:hypothetical protein
MGRFERRRLGQRPRGGVLGDAVALRAPAGRHVVELGDDVERSAEGVAHQRNVDLHRDAVAVRVPEAPLELVGVVAAVQEPIEEDDTACFVRCAQRLGRRGEQIRLRATDESQERAVDPQEGAVEGDQRHADGRVVEGSGGELVALPEGVLGALALDGVPDRARDEAAVEPSLEQVVLGARAHRLDGQRRVVHAAQDHDRHRRIGLADDVHGLEPGGVGAG